LAVRATAEPVLMRKVVMVTTHDRLLIPPIRQFCELVQAQAGHYLNQTTLTLSHLPTAS